MADSDTTTDKREPWEAVDVRLEKLTNSVCCSWSSELNNLLIFASLFSAIVTAFTVEAARDIHVDPAEQTVLLLRTLVLQVHNISNPQVNLPLNLTPDNSVAISPHAQQIYLLYCVSLALSLISVLGGITSLQWLREFNQNVTGVSHSTDIYVQYQRHKSLKQWRVLTLLNTLPILLLISLFLFFAGFLTSQWGSGALAARPVSFLVGIAVLFILITSFLPALQVVWLANYKVHDPVVDNPSDAPLLCPYRSPQAWLALSLLHHLLRATQYVSSNRLNPLRLMPFNKMSSWTGYDKWWIEKHTTEKSIYPALSWVATEFNQSKDAVLMAYQCLISSMADTFCEYLKTLPQNGTVPDSTAWSAFGFSTISQFETQFIRDKPMLLWNTYLGVFSRIWAIVREKDLKVESSNDIYQFLRVETSSETDCSALLKSISNSLSRPENVWMTEEIAVAVTCHVIDHIDDDSWYCNGVIPILKEMCKRYSNDGTVYTHIRNLCNKLRERLCSKHCCKYSLIIFNGVFRTVDLETLGNLGLALRALLVRCPTCYIPYWRAEEFLKIINNLVTQRLISKDHSLDTIFRHTAYILRRSTRLNLILPSIETTLIAILSAAEEHVHLSTSTTSVFHPSRFSLAHCIAHPDYPTNLKPVWDVTDNFNKRLKEIWAKRDGVNSNSGQVSMQRIKKSRGVRYTSIESTTIEEGEGILTPTSSTLSNEADYDIRTGIDGWGMDTHDLSPTIFSSPLPLLPSIFIDNLDEPRSSSSQPTTTTNNLCTNHPPEIHDGCRLQCDTLEDYGQP